MRTRTPERGLLTVVGAINWDVTIFEDRFPRPGEEVPIRLVEEYPGGKGANVAVAAARVLGPKEVNLIGALGDDEVSKAQLLGLRGEGVQTDGVVTLKGRRSGRAYIIVDEHGRKTIHTHFGANGELSPGHLAKGGGARAISRSSMLVVMDPPTDVARAAARLAGKRNTMVVYCPGVRAQERLESVEEVVRAAKVLVLDSSELKSLCQTEDEESALGTLTEAYPGLTVVATLGARGCFVAKGRVNTQVGGVNLASLGLRAVNSTGSGDAFLGVFVAYLLKGKTAIEAVAWANLAGALKASRYETRGSPGAEELEARMKSLRGLRPRPPGSRASRVS